MEKKIRLDYLEKSLAFLRGVLDSPEKIAWCRDFGSDVPESFQAEVGEFLLGYRESGADTVCRDAVRRLGGESADAFRPLSGELKSMSDGELESQLAGLMDGGSPFVLYGMSSGLLYRLFSELLSRRRNDAAEGCVSRLDESDLADVAALSESLRPGSGEVMSRSFRRQLADPKAALFGCRRNGVLIGLAHARIRRDYVEGAKDSKNGVAYLEGICLREDAPGSLALELIDAVGCWAGEMGCRELAADCAADDIAGAALRESAGFAETARIICYIKEL